MARGQAVRSGHLNKIYVERDRLMGEWCVYEKVRAAGPDWYEDRILKLGELLKNEEESN